jgi:16S rRNA (adenine1518-N6/adenine1519-N6)-dimethyltransferase
MPQTLTDIRALLAAHGLHPKHALGQNFLHDANQARKIVAAAELQPGDLVLEVGPGTGALTQQLLGAEPTLKLLAVEVDEDLQPVLQSVLESYGPRVQLLIADVLASKHAINPRVFDALRELAGPENAPGDAQPRFKLIANLPYNVASPLLANLAADCPAMTLAIAMVQREVAARIAAPPGGKDYGPLTIIVQAMCHVERVATLSPGCFWPAPKVDSAVLRLTRRERPLTGDPAALSATAQRLFNQRRKQLGAILGRDVALPPGVGATQRPEQLTVEQIIALSESLHQQSQDPQ